MSLCSLFASFFASFFAPIDPFFPPSPFFFPRFPPFSLPFSPCFPFQSPSSIEPTVYPRGAVFFKRFFRWINLGLSAHTAFLFRVLRVISSTALYCLALFRYPSFSPSLYVSLYASLILYLHPSVLHRSRFRMRSRLFQANSGKKQEITESRERNNKNKVRQTPPPNINRT